jgi:ElaB/YqjD/DUF883 family membrane-anchored ribosome-binding protein
MRPHDQNKTCDQRQTIQERIEDERDRLRAMRRRLEQTARVIVRAKEAYIRSRELLETLTHHH